MTALPSFFSFFRRGILNPRAYFLRHRIRQNRKEKKKEPNVGRRHNRDGPDVKSMTRQLTQTHSVSHTTHLMSPLDITREAIGNIYQNLEVKLEYLFQQNLNLPLNNKKMIQRSYRRQIPEAQAFFFILLT